jgi:hypothetical protein
MSGTIYTFYSYKGGVGRSMALANLAAHFFKLGFTTLIIDWDLEAPGLERYFEERYRLDVRDVNDRPGLCDMLNKYMENVAKPASEDDGGLPCPPVEEYLYQLDHQNGASLWLMHAGRRTDGEPWEKYASFVQGFDWAGFYGEWEGGAYLEWLRKRLKGIADVILIDSRTGVTEMGGVASQHLADAVVMFCGANLQNIVNTARMASNFLSAPVRAARGDRPLKILVAPSRIDDADSEGYREFIRRFGAEFDKLPTGGSDDDYDAKEMLIPYLAHFSYREKLIVGDSEAETVAARLLAAYRAIAANMKSLADEDSALKTGRSEVTHAARPNVFIAYSRDDESYARNIISALSERGVSVNGGDQRKLKQEDVEAQLGQAHALLVLLTKSAVKSKTVQRLVRHAEEMSKHIIPVILEEVTTPLWIADRKPLDFTSGFEKGVESLVQTVHALSSSSSAHAEGASMRLSKMVYLSYSHVDSATARIVSDRLTKEGYITWTDTRILPGMAWADEIEKALEDCDAMVALISYASANSAHVSRELNFVSRSLNKPLLPILIDPKAKMPYSLADKLYIDMTRDPKRALDQLTKALHHLLARHR